MAIQTLTCGLPWLVGIFIFVATAGGQTAIQTETTPQGIWFTEGGHRVLFFQRATKSRNGQFPRAAYVHPLYDLDQRVITEDFPADHWHQRGIFWAWHQITVAGRVAGDPWLARDFLWEVTDVRTSARENYAELNASVLWKSPLITDDVSQLLPIVTERTRIRVYSVAGDQRKVDFEIRLTAMQDNVAIGGSDDDKGYGGFSCRFVLPDDIRFLSRRGAVTPQRTAIRAGNWIDVSGTFAAPGRDRSPGGKQSRPVKPSGIAILCHPSSAGFPQDWILRSRDSMQNPVFPGRQTVALSRVEPIVLRYRLVLHRDAVPPSTIELWYQEFARLKFSDP